MRTSIQVFRIGVFVTASLLLTLPSSFAQQQQQPASESEDVLMPEQFTEILKQVWSTLKNEMEDYQNSIATKGEFETSREYDRRLIDAKRQYLEKVAKYSRDQKLDQRVFSILFKAKLGTYDADKQMFTLSSPTVVDAPYNIPSVQCVIRKNAYIALADSIRKGYRISSLYVHLPRGNKWKVSRDIAREAKNDEDNLFFRVKMMVNIVRPDVRTQAILELVPKELALYNNQTKKVYWAVPIR